MRFLFNDSHNKQIRRGLRRTLTEEERLLWSKIRKKQLGVVFRRQFGIGRFVVDFYCPEKRLVIELDGGQHNDDERKIYD